MPGPNAKKVYECPDTGIVVMADGAGSGYVSWSMYVEEPGPGKDPLCLAYKFYASANSTPGEAKKWVREIIKARAKKWAVSVVKHQASLDEAVKAADMWGHLKSLLP